MISGIKIHELHKAGSITIDPFKPSQCGPNSYDCRLGVGMKRVVPNRWPFIDTHRQGKTKPVKRQKDGSYILWPWFTYLGITAEIIGSDSYVGKIHGRSSVARHGAMTHLCAGFCDAGWIGKIVLEIKNCNFWPIKLYPGDRVCQVEFESIDGEVKLYNSTYQHQSAIMAGKALGD